MPNLHNTKIPHEYTFIIDKHTRNHEKPLFSQGVEMTLLFANRREQRYEIWEKFLIVNLRYIHD